MCADINRKKSLNVLTNMKKKYFAKTIVLYVQIIILTYELIINTACYGWTPPIGIPEPEFGIKETHNNYKGKEFAFSSGKRIYPDAGYGPYTHYVDSRSPNATDTNNPYGSPEKPRMTIPTSFEAGAIIEVHGPLSNVRSQIILQINGTKDNPVFIRGVSKNDRPLIENKQIILTGVYCILENFEFSNTTVLVRTLAGGIETHHIAIRNTESHSLNNSAFTAISSDTTKKTSNVVFYNNYLHGNAFNPDDSIFQERDACGIYLGIGSDKVWIVDNHINTFPGDAVGGGHAAKYTVTNYYIGRNNLNTCGENAIDTKEVENVVISQNKMHNMKGWSSGSNGTAAVVHYGPKYSSKNVWFLFNEIYDCEDNGIQVGGDQQYDVYIIGNIIRDIKNKNKTGCAYRTWSSKKVHLINNTIYNVDIGVQSDVNNEGAILVLKNNIISNVTNYMLAMSGSWHLNNSIIDNNLFYNTDGIINFKWNQKIFNNLLLFQANSAKCKGCLSGDPFFENETNNNFELRNDSLVQSPAIDRGSLIEYDSLYMAFFGIPLNIDHNGNPRFIDGDNDGVVNIDIGCFEANGMKKTNLEPQRFRRVN